MGIEFTFKTSSVHFRDLSIGDTFMYQGQVFMRVEDARLTSATMLVNAINLSTGKFHSFIDHGVIAPIKLKASGEIHG